MRITCFYDNGCDMGYIYLKPQKDDEFDEYERSKNEINKYINPVQINIPYVIDQQLAPCLDQMTVASNTFKTDHENGYATEYGNDMDEHGYVTGIELSLSLKRFIDLVKNQAFKVIRTEWRNKEFHLITFDHAEDVFKPQNVIYKLTDEEDAFVIVQLVEPEKLGYHYTDDTDQKRPIALFKALISATDDIYPLEYLLKPEFYLKKDERVPIAFEPADFEAFGLEYWESMTNAQRELIINNLYCSHCSNAVKFIDCKLAGDGDGVLIMGNCDKCGNEFVRYVERDD